MYAACFPRSPPQCGIHGLDVSEEFSTERRLLAEVEQQKLNWAIHPRGSTKMSLFRDCGVCCAGFWKPLLVCNVRAPLKGKCDYAIKGSPRWTTPAVSRPAAAASLASARSG